MRIIYSTDSERGKDMFSVIDNISSVKMVEKNLIEMQLADPTDEGNDIIYIELANEALTRRTVYNLFEVGRVDLTGEFIRIHFDCTSYYSDEEDTELEERLEESDWDDEDE